MTRTHAVSTALLLTGLVVAGCGSSTGREQAAATTSAGPAPVCQSVDALQGSVDALRNVQVAQQGTDALSGAVNQVKADLQSVVADARSQYAADVDRLQVDVTAVQTAADTVRTDPSTTNLGAVGTAIRVLADDVQSFSGEVAKTC